MNYILKKALEMAAVLGKSERLFPVQVEPHSAPARMPYRFSFTRLGIWRRRRIDG